MKRGGWQVAFGIVAFLSTMFYSCQQVSADPAGLNLTVSPLLPDNQQTTDVNYYDLLIEPGGTQTVTLMIDNNTDRERIIAIELNPASTNHNGMVDYIPIDPNKEWVPFDIREVVTVEKEIKINANESVDVPIEIKMPETTYDGVVAGGLKVREILTADEENEDAVKESTSDSSGDESYRSSSIVNSYTYVVALLLRQNETVVTPEITLGGMALTNINNQDAIGIDLDNVRNTYVQDVCVEAEVSLEGGDLTFTSKQSGKKIAPASTYTYPVPVDADLPAGEYQVKAVVYSEKAEDGEYEASDGKKYKFRWELNQTFVLEEKVIQGNKDMNTFIPKARRWPYVLGFVGLGGSFAGIAFYLQSRKLGSGLR